MSTVPSPTSPTDGIPVIDIAPLRDGSDAIGVGKALHQASRKVGFIYIKNHGIPEELVSEAHEAAMNFFRLPDSTKDEVSISDKHRGWLRQGGAVMDDGMPSDLKESFLWGLEDDDGQTPEDHPLRGPNLWPQDLKGFRDISRDYFGHAHRVAHELMKGFALGLELEEGFFMKTTSKPLSRASYVYYPPQPAASENIAFGVGPHTDFGVITVLCQDSVGGLQVQGLDGGWIDATPIEGTLIVNVGDLLHRWTGGEYRSTPHRVINTSDRERLSLVLAYDPDPETLIDARQLLGERAQDVEAPITCGDYLIWRFGRAFSYRQKNA